MNNSIKTILFFIAALAITSCDKNDENNSPVRDVEYYFTHADAREAMIAKCNNNPGELEDTPDCINATEASIRAMNESIDRAIRQE